MTAPDVEAPRPRRQPGGAASSHIVQSHLAIPTPNEVATALGFIPADDREIWVRMGMAVKSALGDAGFDIWRLWSQSSERYCERDARDVWRSVRPDGPVTAASLFAEARAHGYRTAHHGHEAPKTPEGIWQAGTESGASEHPYLREKAVGAHGVRVSGRTLLVPVRALDGKLLSVQAIFHRGGRWEKRFTKNAKLGDGCHIIGTLDSAVIILAEGYATGATLHEAAGYPVAVAFDCGRLASVGRAIRARHPRATILVAGDEDSHLASNPGRSKAARAAEEIHAHAVFPVFQSGGGGDFNDLAVDEGVDAVRKQIDQALSDFRAKADELLGLAKPLRAAGTASAPAPDELLDPLPLPKLPPVPDFPLDILPDDLRDWVADAADRARFRPEFAAVAGMAALGSVIGRKVGIRLKAHDDWTEFANVWGMVVGSPSSLKSPAMRDALRPFKALQATADERHADAMREHAAQTEGHKLRRDAKRKAAAKALAKDLDAEVDLDLPPPEAPVARTYWTSDATAERLGELLAENPTGLLVERDELSSLLVSLEDERQATARGLYLSGWSGQEGYRFDRIMRGTTTLPKFALSVVGGIQPGPLARYVRGAFSGERADGLLQRFQLLVWPDPEPFVLVDRPPNQSAREKAGALFAFADALDGDAVGIRPKFGNEPPFVRLSAEAQAIFAEWYTEFMLNRRASEAGGESAALGAHFGKYPGLLGKLCLILHVADEPDAPAVSERTLLKGLAWLEYLTPHARRAYHAVDKPETGAAELLLARLRRGELPPLFKAWEISRKCWHGLGEREVVRSACRLLLEFGWLVEADPGGATGGRPSDPTYAISPKARGWA